MQPLERRKLIIEELSKNEKIDIDQLATNLNVSSMTIRRDLNALEFNKKIIRTHGGAVLQNALVHESSFVDKEGKFMLEKREIAKEAVNLIQDGSTILMDSGTTTLEIAKLLKGRQGFTVITNDIKIAVALMDSEVKVIIAGGELQNNIGALFGPLTENMLKEIHVDLCFLGAHAAHPEVGITAPTHEKAAIKKLMIDAAEKTWLVADSSKFNKKSLATVCDLSGIDGVITDHHISDNDKIKIKEHLEIITVWRTLE